MLTPDQERWVAHLSDQSRIRIVPFDPTAALKFEAVKQRIQAVLGADVRVEHHGATSLGISGQDEIDIYLPVSAASYDGTVEQLRRVFGDPRSLYPAQRARFAIEEDGKHVDIFVSNEEHDNWRDLTQFEGYLHAHQTELERYRLLKEQGNGMTVRAYYRRKLEFINQILDKCYGR